MHSVAQSPETISRCVKLIQDQCGVVIHDMQTIVCEDHIQITGVVGSWHGKQLASEAARSLYPDRRIDNQLQVIKVR